MKFVNCPKCGHKLLEGESGSCVNVKCNKCKSVVNVKLHENTVNLSVISCNELCKQDLAKQ